VVNGVEVEILEGVEAVGPTGDLVVATPNLDQAVRVIVSGRRIPVLPLSTIYQRGVAAACPAVPSWCRGWLPSEQYSRFWLGPGILTTIPAKPATAIAAG
jgi:hypothetical protein